MNTRPAALTNSAETHGVDAAFEQLSRTTTPAVVNSITKMLGYPLDRVAFETALLLAHWRTGLLANLVLRVRSPSGVKPATPQRHTRRDLACVTVGSEPRLTVRMAFAA